MSTPLPRRSLAWLLFALVLAIGPHALRLPPWVLVVMGVAIAWRYRVHQGAWSFPTRPVKLLLVVMSFLAVGLHWRALSGLEPAVALLAIAGGLKAMEMRTTRDFLVVVFVAYFLVASQLLFEQEIPYALYAVVATAGVTAAMVARHQGDPAPGFPHPLVLTGKLLAQAAPVMLLLFVVFPRIAPLWAIPQNTQSARTGPSDSMSPGDVARLSGSNALALRATFEGAIPAQRELYWRGLVFSEFDGRQWRQGAMARMEAELAQQGAPRPALRQLTHVPSGEETSYEVILEPSNQPWAYVIGFPVSFDANLRSGSDYRLMSSRPLTQRLRYRVRADLGAQLEPELGILRRRTELQLPEGFNPRALAQAKAWRAEAPSDAAYIERVLRWFTEEEFVYTMSPPLLGRDTVDEFLFGERRGFCEHYASAFAVLLRAAGIPARVVVGYQGGERNPYQAYLLVHQFDAHAWTEAWLDGRGWVRFDPTAAVAPQRIESGAGEALGAEFLADSPLAIERYRNVRLLGWMRMRWDMMTYHWARLVLNYDAERQGALLSNLLGRISPARVVAVMLGCGALVLLLVAASLFGVKPRPRRDAATAAYLRICERLAASGLERRRGEGPFDYARRVTAVRPDLGAELQALTADYVALAFAQGAAGDRALPMQRLRQAVRRFRPRRAPIRA
jgi:transglutaminase-like putative cysteine protease